MHNGLKRAACCRGSVAGEIFMVRARSAFILRCMKTRLPILVFHLRRCYPL